MTGREPIEISWGGVDYIVDRETNELVAEPIDDKVIDAWKTRVFGVISLAEVQLAELRDMGVRREGLDAISNRLTDLVNETEAELFGDSDVPGEHSRMLAANYMGVEAYLDSGDMLEQELGSIFGHAEAKWQRDVTQAYYPDEAARIEDEYESSPSWAADAKRRAEYVELYERALREQPNVFTCTARLAYVSELKQAVGILAPGSKLMGDIEIELSGLEKLLTSRGTLEEVRLESSKLKPISPLRLLVLEMLESGLLPKMST